MNRLILIFVSATKTTRQLGSSSTRGA